VQNLIFRTHPLPFLKFSAKKIWAKPKQAGKKKKGCGENEFLPACLPAEGGMGGKKRFRNSCVSRKAKQKNFRFLN